jgi:hypothetical protein
MRIVTCFRHFLHCTEQSKRIAADTDLSAQGLQAYERKAGLTMIQRVDPAFHKDLFLNTWFIINNFNIFILKSLHFLVFILHRCS